MTCPATDRCDPAMCPTDLCCHGDCHCSPSAPRGDRLTLQALGLGAAALAVAGLPLSGLLVPAITAAVGVGLVCAGGWILIRPS